MMDIKKISSQTSLPSTQGIFNNGTIIQTKTSMSRKIISISPNIQTRVPVDGHPYAFMTVTLDSDNSSSR